MSHYTSRKPGQPAVPLRSIHPPLAQGGEAAIHAIEGQADQVAKCYLRSRREQSRDKLLAMLQSPPRRLHTESDSKGPSARPYPLLAWPQALLEQPDGTLAGFVMPRMPDGAVTLTKYTSRALMERDLLPEDRSLATRVSIARNIAAVLAELHAQGHHVVDIKPQNIFMFPGTGRVCFVDTDSFSILEPGTGRRFPATAFSAEYRAPELLRERKGPDDVVDDTQDRFALAVLLFQLLTGGFHPFQGRPTQSRNDWSIELCVEQGLYPYSNPAHPAILPPPHRPDACLPQSLMALFNQAFTATPTTRPTAAQWREACEELIRTRAFSACVREPNDVLHIHFATRPCAECKALELQQKYEEHQSKAGSDSRSPAQQTSPEPASSASGQPAAASRSKPWLTWLVAAVVLGSCIWLLAGSPSPPSEAPTSTPSAPAEEAKPAPAELPIAPEPGPAEPARPPGPVVSSAEPPEAAASLARRPEPEPELANASDDVDTLGERRREINDLLPKIAEQSRSELSRLIEAGRAGQDAVTLELARDLMRSQAVVDRLQAWPRQRPEARKLNAVALGLYRSDLPTALRLQARAMALDPLDREIVGNLAFYRALNQEDASAWNLAVLALTLPRPVEGTGRGADWQLIGSLLARRGQVADSAGAYGVALAITTNLSGLCKSLLAQQSDFGDALKPPINEIFQRIAQRGQSDQAGCAWPPAWGSTP